MRRIFTQQVSKILLYSAVTFTATQAFYSASGKPSPTNIHARLLKVLGSAVTGSELDQTGKHLKKNVIYLPETAKTWQDCVSKIADNALNGLKLQNKFKLESSFNWRYTFSGENKFWWTLIPAANSNISDSYSLNLRISTKASAEGTSCQIIPFSEKNDGDAILYVNNETLDENVISIFSSATFLTDDSLTPLGTMGSVSLKTYNRILAALLWDIPLEENKHP